MADISNVVTVNLNLEPVLARAGNINTCAIFTSNNNVLSTSERFRSYRTLTEVESDFGTSSQESVWARRFFGAPNPVQAGGELVFSFWRAADETVPAKAAELEGGQVVTESLIPQLQQITDGEFDVTVDGGAVQNITALDFSGIDSADEAAAILDAAISGASVVFDGNLKFVLTSDTTGASSTLTYATEPAAPAGTFIGDLLQWTPESGGQLTQGAASDVLTAESKLDAINALQSELFVGGMTFIARLTDQEIADIASKVQADQTTLFYYTFNNATNLQRSQTNPAWKVKTSGQTFFRMTYTTANQTYMAAAYMSKTHSVLLSGQNTTKTLNLKTLTNIEAEPLSQTEINAAESIGMDVYIPIKDTSNVLSFGANDYTDNIYNIAAFAEDLRIGLFNLLRGTATKIPQTAAGVATVVQGAATICNKYVRNGFIAAGEWTRPADTFGNLDTFLNAIRTKGYYILGTDPATQLQSERQERKITLQIAIKLAGAIHIVNVNVVDNK
jgi:hypothetical protein